MPPFFFDFFFLAFVGLFTRFSTCNCHCLRILPFFFEPIFPNCFPRRATQLRRKSVTDFSFLDISVFPGSFSSPKLGSIPPENLETKDYCDQGSQHFALERK